MNTEQTEHPAPLTPRKQEAAPATVALVVILVTLAGFAVVGPFIGLAIAYPFYSGNPFDFITDIAQPEGKEYMKLPLLIVQGCSTFVGLAVVPGFFWTRLKHRRLFSLIKENPLPVVYFIMAAGIVVFFTGPNSVFIEWNSNLNLPDGGFEVWAKDFEARAGELTKFLTSFSSFGQYLMGVLVIAILPALGEELVFRGFLQPELQKMTGNSHAGIWLSAIFFSALHLQFYGFVPRVLLGALFGYLYYWSGNLRVSMFAHFINNFLAVTVIYMGMSELPGMEIDKPSSMPWYAVAITTAIFGFLIYRFYDMLTRSKQNNLPTTV